MNYSPPKALRNVCWWHSPDPAEVTA